MSLLVARDQRDRAVQARPAQRALARGVADHHRHAQVAGERDAAGVGVLVDEDDVEAEVVQPAGHPGADVAAADHDDVPAARPRLAADRPGQPGADDDRGDQRQQRHPVDGEQHLRDLLGDGVRRAGERRPGHVHDAQVQHVARGVPGDGEQDEAGHREREQDAEDDAELVPQQPPGHPERARAAGGAAGPAGRAACRRPRRAPGRRAPSRSSGATSWVVPPGSSGTASPHSTWPGGASLAPATYRVRPDSRTWLGAMSPSAAATSAGAASWLRDSTVQSRKNPVRWSPSRRL